MSMGNTGAARVGESRGDSLVLLPSCQATTQQADRDPQCLGPLLLQIAQARLSDAH
jgi:hypothetical protein